MRRVQLVLSSIALAIGAGMVAPEKRPQADSCSASSLMLDSGDVLTVRGCSKSVPSPFGDDSRWVQYEADDRPATYVVRVEQVIGVALRRDKR